MDFPSIESLARFVPSPFVGQRFYQPSETFVSSLKHPSTELPWISDASEFAQSGVLQGAVIFTSAAWLSYRLMQQRSVTVDFKAKASSIKWRYEIVLQLLRWASVVFLAVAYSRGRAHILNVAALIYASVLGLLRLINDVHWRHDALHQINFVMPAMLVILSVAQFLPCVQLDVTCAKDASIVGGIAAVSAAVVMSFITPREWVPPTFEFEIPGFEVDTEPAPEELCGWLDYYCTYEWLTPMIWKGTKGKLDISGVPKLAWYDEPLYLLHKVQVAREKYKTTMWTTLAYMRKELTLMSIWIAASFAIENVSPFALYKLLDYLKYPEQATYQPWLWLLLMFAGPVVRSVLFQQYIYVATRLIVRIKSGMTQELYNKALTSMELEDDPFEQNRGGPEVKEDKGNPKQRTTSAGRLANLMSADVDAIYKSRDIIQCFIGVPIGTIVSVAGLYRMLGWPALMGVGVLIASTPISAWFAKLIYNTQRNVRRVQDSRISLVTEYLASIRAIKYFAWERPITEKIVDARAKEQMGLWRVAILQTLINEVTQAFPCIALVVMFGLHVGLEQRPLEASTAFTTVLLVGNIRRNIMMVSGMSRGFASALVAIGRLDKYFESTVPLVKYPTGPLRIQNASFRRTKKATFSLDEVTLDFIEGGLNVVTGQSGSGKSTLLLAILGETYLEAGTVTVPDDIAYASQSSWLQNETVEDNILFGSPMERARYDRVVKACCLTVDFNELADGDQTQIGENGTSLSGGQRARVALARALYSKAPLLLLDDIFAALDAKTAAGVWKYCFCGDLLRGRTTVLVTQVPWIAEQADLSISLDKGRVKSVEPNIGVVRRPITIAEVLGGDADDEDITETPPEPELQPNTEASNDAAKIAKDAARSDLVNQEMKATGKSGRWIFLQYMGYMGNPFFVSATIVVLVIAIAFTFSIDYWLSIWVDAYAENAHVDIAFYLSIFVLFNALEVISYGIVVVMFEWGAWRAGRKLHNDFIRAVMAAPLSWFKAVPVGRITNRFSGDMASVDGMLSSMLRYVLHCAITLFFHIGAVSSIMPVFMIPALGACLFGVVIGEMFTRTAVIVRRLVSSSQSPVFSLFADTLAGLPTIRARADKADAFREDLASKLRIWSASSVANYNCNRWVSIRVDLVTALVSLSAGIIAVNKAGLVPAGLVGFSLTNANSLSQTIIALVRFKNELEVEMQSFHRVKEYVKLEPEGKDDEPFPEEGEYTDHPGQVIPKNWPTRGLVEFRNVTVRYDPDGPDILTDVNLEFRAGERVAVVGRTGSGKSTLILSLLRFTHVVSGQILYDGIDITKLPRRKLREGLTIIPQEPVLFSGTVGSNLDPTGLVPDETLEKALDNCRGIASFSDEEDAATESLDGNDTPPKEHSQTLSLSTEVNARGENFSHGQRQVLSLCRALIRKNKLLLLDEATASMDYETDRGIQQVLRNELEAEGKDRTLVTIAHRLRTIIDYNTVVVMAAGRVVESGSPRELYDAKGQFYEMVIHSGEDGELQELLET